MGFAVSEVNGHGRLSGRVKKRATWCANASGEHKKAWCYPRKMVVKGNQEKGHKTNNQIRTQGENDHADSNLGATSPRLY